MNQHAGKGRIRLAIGVVMLLASLLGFLGAAVALARVQEAPVLAPGLPGRLELATDDPLVQKRRQQAEIVLFGSLLVGGVGAVTLVVGLRARRSDR